MTLLGDTLASLRDAHSWRTLAAGAPLTGGWVSLRDVVRDDDVLHRWLDDLLAGEAKGRHDVAGSYLAWYLGGIVAEPVVDALVARDRAWPTTAENLYVRRHELGWFDGFAIASPEVYVLPDDERAGDPDARIVRSYDEMQELVAVQVAQLLEPVFAALRRMARFGRRGMWGSVADGIGASTMWAVRARSGDAERAWRRAVAVTDRLARHAPMLTVRPQLELIDCIGGTQPVTVKGTCCLYYKVHDGVPDPHGEGYCLTCPKRAVESRHERWRGYLDAPAADTT
jgi:ferric iron reductase protein FhuF